MVNALFEKGREGFLDGSFSWSATLSAALIDLDTPSVAVKAVTGATNATPIVITATAHGFANGDFVYVDKVGGNLAANGLWKIANVAANTFELTNPVSGANVVGSGAYTSGGFAANYGPSAVCDNFDDWAAGLVGSKVNLGTLTTAQGVADAADVTFPSVTGNTVEGLIVFKDTGTNSTSRVIAIQTGKLIVTAAAQAAAAATTIAVEILPAPIPNGTVLTFSNGATATLAAVANIGDRAITVTALAAIVTAGSRAIAPCTGSGFPASPNSGNIAMVFDNGPNKIFKL